MSGLLKRSFAAWASAASAWFATSAKQSTGSVWWTLQPRCPSICVIQCIVFVSTWHVCWQMLAHRRTAAAALPA